MLYCQKQRDTLFFLNFWKKNTLKNVVYEIKILDSIGNFSVLANF